MPEFCSITECDRSVKSRGWCEKHYHRWIRRGDPLWTPPPPSERFWANVEKGDGCWIWTAARVSQGYGAFTIGRVQIPAHRFAYEEIVGPIPEGLFLDHLCRTPPCVNPAHLEPVTCKENILRGTAASAKNAAKTHCDHGHPFSPENTRITPKGHRECRTCRREITRKYLDRKKAS